MAVLKSKSRKSFSWKHIPGLLWETAKRWNDEDVWQLSASIAYYAILSLPGFLVILINVVGAFYDVEIATGRLTGELASFVGYDAASDITKILQAARIDNKSVFATVLGIGTLLFAATGVFAQLQLALNKLWRLKINPKTPWWRILTDRAKSFGFIVAIGFLILISFLLSSVIAIVQNSFSDSFSNVLGVFVLVINFCMSLAIISLMFGLMFRFLPDALVKWRLIWPGAILTGVLFESGKFLLEIYFTNSNPASAYGAAGLVVLLLLWVSYSCLILFYGAIFIKLWIERYDAGIKPSLNAIKYKEELLVTESGDGISNKDETEINEILNSEIERKL